MSLVYAATAGLLFAVGLYGLLGRSALLHRLLGTNLMASAVFLYLVVVATDGAGDPDPVPQAMVLTGIIIAVSLTAVGLGLVRYFHALGTARALEDEDRPDG